MMADLIDRQAAKDVIHKRLGTMDLFESRFNTDIDAIPAVDAVEVVRCKDCKYWAHGDCYRLELSRPNDFCSYGERREDDGTAQI